MKLLTASASPFANKVRMAAELIGLEVESVAVDAVNTPPELQAANPLGKIPCLVLDDGRSMFDSRAITHYFFREHAPNLYPAGDNDALFTTGRYEALCDGICDCAVAWQYEHRMRPEEKWHQPWIDRQWSKVMAGLTEAAKDLPEIGDKADIRAIALAATLGYLQLRFEGKWETGNESLVEWINAFDAAHPAVAALKPSA